eukprot:SAG11_NODE_3126_length_2667_cov_4.469237_3_plen_147_part_01
MRRTTLALTHRSRRESVGLTERPAASLDRTRPVPDCSPFEHVGELALLTGQPRAATVAVVGAGDTMVECYRLMAEDFRRRVRRRPAAAPPPPRRGQAAARICRCRLAGAQVYPSLAAEAGGGGVPRARTAPRRWRRGAEAEGAALQA